MTQIETAAPTAAPARVGQQTAVEQSRAVEEVRAAIIVAQQCPRDIQAALSEMRESCKVQRLADRAFYAYPRGGQTITGASVYLARELARCWRNIQFGIAELSRDDSHGQSEMQAWAWDVQNNTRSVAVFIVPHKRDKTVKGKQVTEALPDLRSVYENNANNGARRLRECIFSVLPPWFVEEAKDICVETVKAKDSEKPLAMRIAEVVDWYGGRWRVDEDALVRKMAKATSRWTEHDLAQLRVLGASLGRGEVTVEESFPAVTSVTVEEIRGQQQAPTTPPTPAPAPAAAAPPVEREPAPGPGGMSNTQRSRLFAMLKDLGVVDREPRLRMAARLLNMPGPLGSFSDLTAAQADDVAVELAQLVGLPEAEGRAQAAILAAPDQEPGK